MAYYDDNPLSKSLAQDIKLRQSVVNSSVGQLNLVIAGDKKNLQIPSPGIDSPAQSIKSNQRDIATASITAN